MREQFNKFDVGDLVDYKRYDGMSNEQKFAIVLAVNKSIFQYSYHYRIYKQLTQTEEWIEERWLDKVE